MLCNVYISTRFKMTTERKGLCKIRSEFNEYCTFLLEEMPFSRCLVSEQNLNFNSHLFLMGIWAVTAECHCTNLPEAYRNVEFIFNLFFVFLCIAQMWVNL